jgi:hypothetical protein
MHLKNKFLPGLLLGILFPLIGFCLIYIFWFYDNIGFIPFIKMIMIRKDTLSGVLSLSLILNLPVFFLNIWSKREEVARGIIFATMLFGVVIIYLKFF